MAVRTYWDNYAFIYEGKIQNVAVFDPNGSYTIANMMAKEVYGPSAFAVNVNDFPVQIGDTYSDGCFYRGAQQIDRVDEVADEFLEIKQALAELGTLIGG